MRILDKFEKISEVHDVEIFKANSILDYNESLDLMNDLRTLIFEKKEKEKILLLEYDNVYTAGSRDIEKNEILSDDNFKIFKTSRGGKLTYHSKGQRIIYFLINLKKRQKILDLKKFIFLLEQLVIDSLRDLNIDGFRKEGEVGVWLNGNSIESKIAFIGIEVKKGISSHGVAINIVNNLSGFKKITPCGIENCSISSISEVEKSISMQKFDDIFLLLLKKLLECNFYEL